MTDPRLSVPLAWFSDAELIEEVRRRGLTVRPVPEALVEVVDFVAAHPGCRNRDIREALGINNTAAAMRLMRARDAGYLRMEGKGHTTKWWPEVQP